MGTTRAEQRPLGAAPEVARLERARAGSTVNARCANSTAVASAPSDVCSAELPGKEHEMHPDLSGPRRQSGRRRPAITAEIQRRRSRRALRRTVLTCSPRRIVFRGT